MKTLETAKTFINFSSNIDFCSNNVMNFSGKFFYSTIENFPSAKSMSIYQYMDKFKFINNLYTDICTFTKREIESFVEKLPYLENVYFFSGEKYLSYDEIRKNTTEESKTSYLDFNFLIEKKLNTLVLDYSFFDNPSSALWISEQASRIFEAIPPPGNICVRNLTVINPISHRSTEKSHPLKKLNDKLIHFMGDNVEILKIHDQSPYKIVGLKFSRIVFGSNLDTFVLFSHDFKNLWNNNISIMGETKKIRSLTVVPYSIENPENCIYYNLRHLCFYFVDEKFGKKINNFKLWFPNLINLEIYFQRYDYIMNYEITQRMINMIYDCFPEITITFDLIGSNPFQGKIVFHGDVIFKVTHNFLDFREHVFKSDPIFDLMHETYSPYAYDKNFSLIISANQKFTLIGYEIAFEKNISPTVKLYYIIVSKKENINYMYVNDFVKINPSLIDKNIRTFVMRMKKFDSNIFVPYKIVKLDMNLKIQSGKIDLVINNSNFPNLEEISCKNINIVLNKSIANLKLESSTIRTTEKICVLCFSLLKCKIYDISQITFDSNYLSIVSSLFMENMSLNYSSLNVLKLENNISKKGISLFFNDENSTRMMRSINIKNNKIKIVGKLKIAIPEQSEFLSININIVQNPDFCIIFEGKTTFCDSSCVKLEGDNIHADLDVIYNVQNRANLVKSKYNTLPESNVFFVKSKNITGNIYLKYGNCNSCPKYIAVNHSNKIFTKKSRSFECNYGLVDYMEERKEEIMYCNLLIWKDLLSDKKIHAINFSHRLAIFPDFSSNGIYYPVKIVTVSER